MMVKTLSLTRHDQQTAIFELNVSALTGGQVLETELAFRAQ
tara:strand:- start:18 stop:140 length:123 start_codon:yes stop_codon:yes gene_type:complete